MQMESAAKPYQRPQAGQGTAICVSQVAPRARQHRGAVPLAVLQLGLVTSALPRYHIRQLPLHELLHALVLGGPLQEEAE